MNYGRELVCADIQQGWLNLEHRIDVADAGGVQVVSMTFREAFEFRGETIS